MTSVYLLREALPSDNPVVNEARIMIERQVNSMKLLVDGLLDIARLSLNRIELNKARVDLGEVVSRAVESLRSLVDERRHELTIAAGSEPILMSADPTRLEQAVAAMVSNAARFTDPGGRITIAVVRDQGQAVVRVRDTGVGMEPEMLERAFELFAQAGQGLARTVGGLGVGLTLARNLALLHGGSLVGESEGPGKGSEFVLRVPIVPPETAPVPASLPDGTRPRPAGVGSDPPSPSRILLVDDNLDAARSTELLLRQAGHDVIVAHDGAAAIEIGLRHRPDVAILDVGLPRIDGYGVARELRRRTAITLVAVTGYAPEKLTGLLFDAYLVKPVQPEELVGLLATLR